MTRVRLGILSGALVAFASIGACALDESGVASDGGNTLDVTTDVAVDGGPDVTQDAPQDVTYDIPDLGVGETESGLPCTCVPTPPTGYIVVEYVGNQRPACTTGYGTVVDSLENAAGQPAQCSCTCGTTPSSSGCSCGNNPATFDISSGNGNCTDITNESVVANAGNCYTQAQPLFPNGNKLNNMLAAPASACTAGGTCAPPTKVANVPDASADLGRACQLSAATTTCTNGTCIPTQGSPFAMCITNGTLQQCPSGFPIPHVVGTGINDNRGCAGQCNTCSLVDAGTCGTPQLTLYESDNNCGNSGSSVTIPADGTTCVAAGYNGGTTFNSSKYTITHAGGACAFTGSFAAAGNVTLSGAYRVCCR